MARETKYEKWLKKRKNENTVLVRFAIPVRPPHVRTAKRLSRRHRDELKSALDELVSFSLSLQDSSISWQERIGMLSLIRWFGSDFSKRASLDGSRASYSSGPWLTRMKQSLQSSKTEKK